MRLSAEIKEGKGNFTTLLKYEDGKDFCPIFNNKENFKKALNKAIKIYWLELNGQSINLEEANNLLK